MMLKTLFWLITCVALNSDGAKILGIFHFPSKSHHILGSTLLKALAAKGHQVTMMSPYPLKSPLKNYEDLELTGIMEYKDDMMKQTIDTKNAPMFEKIFAMTNHVERINEFCLNHTVVKDLVKSNRKFDLVIVTWAFWNDAFLGLANELEASTIALSTIGSSMMTNRLTGNPAPYSYIPNVFVSGPEDMTFLQRLANTVSNTLFELFDCIVVKPSQERYRQQYFPKAPPTNELLRNISLVLLNSHFSIESPRPHVPNMVQIGGFHVEEPKELTGELKVFMDSAKEGVVFFSLGSNVKSSELPSDKLKAITNAFSKVSAKVLWKFEDDNVPNLPPNVKIGKWLPQRDILAHPNLKVFVTHGGLLSTIEAVYHGVPMVGIPFFGDQESNVADGVHKGYAIKVNFEELSEEDLAGAINKVLSNPEYRKNIQQRSTVLKDQPLKPMDSAIYWVEYVIRHKGAHHLKTGALKLEWYQYYLLDVLGFILGVVLVSTMICYIIVRKLVKLAKSICKKSSKSKKSKVA